MPTLTCDINKHFPTPPPPQTNVSGNRREPGTSGLAALKTASASAYSVLDIPCGGGVAFRGLRPEQELRYVAADLSPATLPRARAAAYLRADQRGNPVGAYGLGLLLIREGDRAGALEALQRAGERGSVEVADLANAAMFDLAGREGER